MAHSLFLLFFVLIIIIINLINYLYSAIRRYPHSTVYKDLRSVHMIEKKKERLIIMIKIIIIIVFIGRIST